MLPSILFGVQHFHQNQINRIERSFLPNQIVMLVIHGGGLTDTSLSLSLVGKAEWVKVHELDGEQEYEVSGRTSPNDTQIRCKILQYTKGGEPHEIASWPKIERDTLIRQLKDEAGLSIRQIERATGISRGVIAKC